MDHLIIICACAHQQGIRSSVHYYALIYSRCDGCEMERNLAYRVPNFVEDV